MIIRKVMLLGDMAVGKTSIANRLAFDRFETSYKSTIGFDLYRYDVILPQSGEQFQFLIWDTDGNVSQVYAYRFFNRIVKHFDYLLDLHTASFGRINSYYIRADMANEIVRKMAFLQNAQIIVHNHPSDKTLRGTADQLGIPSITVEVGNPNVFQKWSFSRAFLEKMPRLIFTAVSGRSTKCPAFAPSMWKSTSNKM